MSLYVALDGPDGCGKSAQTAHLVGWLRELGHDAVHVREPGSTPVGEALRTLLLARSTGDLAAITEVLLFSAARAELVRSVIAPALAAGRIVVAERCYLSTLVYQLLAPELLVPGLLAPADASRRADVAWFFDLVRRVHGATLPAAIFLLDVPPVVGRARRAARTDDRIEARGDAFAAAVRDGFRCAAALDGRVVPIDAAWPLASVQASLRAYFAQHLLPGHVPQQHRPATPAGSAR